MRVNFIDLFLIFQGFSNSDKAVRSFYGVLWNHDGYGKFQAGISRENFLKSLCELEIMNFPKMPPRLHFEKLKMIVIKLTTEKVTIEPSIIRSLLEIYLRYLIQHTFEIWNFFYWNIDYYATLSQMNSTFFLENLVHPFLLHSQVIQASSTNNDVLI